MCDKMDRSYAGSQTCDGSFGWVSWPFFPWCWELCGQCVSKLAFWDAVGRRWASIHCFGGRLCCHCSRTRRFALASPPSCFIAPKWTFSFWGSWVACLLCAHSRTISFVFSSYFRLSFQYSRDSWELGCYHTHTRWSMSYCCWTCESHGLMAGVSWRCRVGSLFGCLLGKNAS